MTVPDVIARYLRAEEEGDLAWLLGCFTQDAKVTDERQTFSGRDEIRRWREEVASKYEYTVDVLGSETVSENEHVVIARLDGNFPGGTVELRHRFVLQDGLVRELEIAP
jgi:hypothetical protein